MTKNEVLAIEVLAIVTTTLLFLSYLVYDNFAPKLICQTNPLTGRISICSEVNKLSP